MLSSLLGLVDPDRLLTLVWSTPKQAIPLIYVYNKDLISLATCKDMCKDTLLAVAYQVGGLMSSRIPEHHVQRAGNTAVLQYFRM